MMASLSRSAVSATRRSLRNAAVNRIAASAAAGTASTASSSHAAPAAPSSSRSISISSPPNALPPPLRTGESSSPSALPVHMLDGKRRAPVPASKPSPLSPKEQANAQRAAAKIAKLRLQKAQKTLEWGLLPAERQETLQKCLENATPKTVFPQWLNEEYKTAKSFYRARSKLWTPSYIENVGSDPEEIQRWLGEQMGALRASSEGTKTPLGDEELLDHVLNDIWLSYSPKQREDAATECGFTCARKLGWRFGYSSGYPLRAGDQLEGQQKDLIAASKQPGAEGQAAVASLQSMDEDAAWAAWVSLSPAKREVEEKAAWAARDRSVLYIDDSPVSTILGNRFPRWFEVPQRAGQLVYLPNYRIRMVPNFTQRGKDYDVWKATFRVPHNVHKHDLRSFLLAVYGLRTTWVRTMVYRTRITRKDFSGSWHRSSRRNYKKAEVGLLEPFIFPKMSERFAARFMHKDTQRVESSRGRFRVNGWRRWRSGHLPPAPKPDETVEALEPKKMAQRFASNADGKIRVTEVQQWDASGRSVEERGGLIRSRKKSSIVQRIAEAREKRMQAVRAKIEELKAEKREESKAEKRE